MANHHPRAIVVGLDAISIKLLQRFVEEGALPNTARLMACGAALPAMSCIPAYTPTNWATLATGAWPGTHGASNWNDAVPTDPPGRRPVSTFDSRAITAETIFEAAERQGLVSLTIAYPGSSPSRLCRGMVVAPLPEGLLSLDMVPGCEYRRSGEALDAEPLALCEARGWPEVPAGSLEAQMVVQAGGPREAGRVGAVEDGAEASGRETPAAHEAHWWLVLPRSPAGYERALLFGERRSRRPETEMRRGEWSAWLVRDFMTPAGRRPAAVRFKLLDLTPDGARVRLVRSAVYPTSGFTEPAELSEELTAAIGPYFENAAMAHRADPITYEESVYDEMEYQVQWHVRVAAYLLENRGWDLFYNHWHFPDLVEHYFLSQADPDSPHYDPHHAQTYLGVLRRAYQLGDRLLGGLMELAGPQTYVALVSDHGNASNKYVCHLARRLRETGLLRRLGREDDSPIDWANTLAYPHTGFQVNVNLKGRESHGSVEPEHFERVQNEIISALHDWRTDDGQRAVALALKKKDAALIGYWGPRAGDVVFVYNAGFAWGNPGGGASIAPAPPGANHGPQVPTAETALSSNLAAWVMAGPGIKPGYRRDLEHLGPARLINFVPTLCHALGIAPPAHCQGAVEHSIFAL